MHLRGVAAAVVLLVGVAAPRWADATVSTSTRTVTYSPTVNTTVFAVTYPFIDRDHLLVTKITEATEAEVTLVQGTDYVVTLPRGSTQGYITTTVAVTSAYTIVIERVVDATQETSFRTQGAFRPGSIEDALDKLTMIVQQLISGEAEDATSAVATHVAQSDPHTQYTKLLGRSGGQSVSGGTATGENLTLKPNAAATNGSILLGAGNSAFLAASDRLGLGTATPTKSLETTDGVLLDTGGSYSGVSIEDGKIKTLDSTGVLTLDAYSGNASGEIRIYGTTHATNPQQIRLGADILTIENEAFSGSMATFDADADLITLVDNVLISSSSVLVPTTLTMSGTLVGSAPTIYGGSASGDDLQLVSSSDATRGSLIFGYAGTFLYDDINVRLGIGDATPDTTLDVIGNAHFDGEISNPDTNDSIYLNDSVRFGVCAVAAGDQTPSVAGCSILTIPANAGPTAITDLDDPQVGQIVHICGTSATNSSTLADSGNFALTGAMTFGVDDCLTLWVQADNDYLELSRAVN